MNQSKEQMVKKINIALNEIRPFLKSDGGDISLIELEDNGTAKIQLHGTCTVCSVNQMTLKSGVEMTIKKYVPEILKVVEVS